MTRIGGNQPRSAKSMTRTGWPGTPYQLAILLLILSVMALGQESSSQTAANSLETISDGLEAVSARTLPCVVTIITDTYMPEPGYYSDKVEESNNPASSSQTYGSGLLVSSDGYIVTNAHVVSGGRHFRVILHPAGADIEATGVRLIGLDETTDLAVLRISGRNLPFMNLADGLPAKQGEIALAFGDPFGMDRTVTMGVVSAVDRQLKPDDPRLWIQTDAAINPGNSGGPLVDARGRLLGIDTLIYNDSNRADNVGVGLAIPTLSVRKVFQDLLKYGHVERDSLGLSPIPVTLSISAALHLTVTSGIMAQDVAVGSAAYQAGIKPGDVIVAVNGSKAIDLAQFNELLNDLKPAAPVTVSVLRGTQPLALQVTTLDDDVVPPLPLAARVSPRTNLVRRLEILGITLDATVEGLVGPTRYPHGVVIAARSSSLRIDSYTLQPHDIIYQVNGKDVANLEGLRELLSGAPPGSPLVLQIERSHRLSYVSLGPATQH